MRKMTAKDAAESVEEDAAGITGESGGAVDGKADGKTMRGGNAAGQKAAATRTAVPSTAGRVPSAEATAKATLDRKYRQMTQAPLRRLILRMAVPAVVANMVSMVYNIVDTFFVGQLGNAASGAVGVVMPLMIVTQALGCYFGQGSGNRLSVELGKRHIERAKRLVAVGFYTAVGVSALVAVIGLLFREPLLRMCGATDTILPYAVEYAVPLLVVSPFVCSLFVLNMQLRFEGLAVESIVGIIVGTVLNIFLEPLMIFTLHLGIFGAGLATAISQTISWIVLLVFHVKRSGVKIHLRNYKVDMPLLREMNSGGLPSLIRNGMLSVSTGALNVAANPYGDAAIAAMTIVSRIMNFINTIQIGLGQGFQPVCGYNYGAHRFDRVRKGYWFIVQLSMTLLLVSSVLLSIFAHPMVSVFRNDPTVIRYGIQALRLDCLTFTLSGFVVPSNMMQQNIGHTVISSLVGLGRQGIFLLPGLWILPAHFGMLGVMLSQPVADVCTFLLTVPLQVYVMRELHDDKPIAMRHRHVFLHGLGTKRS